MELAVRLKDEAEKIAQEKREKSQAPIKIHTDIIAKNSEETSLYSAKNGQDEKKLLDMMLLTLKKVDLIETLEGTIGDDLIKYRNKEGNVDATKISMGIYAVAILKELEIASEEFGWSMAQQDGMIYIYNGKYWIKIEEDDLRRFLSKAAIRLGYYSPAQAESFRFADTLLKQFLLSRYLSEPTPNNNTVLINLQNGTYEISTGVARLREHRSEDFLTYCLPFSLDPKEKAPVFMKYLERVLPDKSSTAVLQEFIGYIFIRHLKLEKALILHGSGQNGKSVLFEIITALLGEVNVSTKSLGDLVDRDSGNDNRAKLKGKLVNYGSEISSKGMNVDMFKRLVSGEPVAAREKYKTAFDLKNNCKFIFNANKLPSEIEHTEAYFRRFIIIPFEVTIPDSEKDPELHTKIIDNELPGILNWAIMGLNRLLSTKKFSECEAAKKALETYKKESNSVAMMVEEEGYIDGHTVEKEYRISNKELYQEYRQYCAECGMHPLNKVNFSKELKSLNFTPFRSGKERGFIIMKEERNIV